MEIGGSDEKNVQEMKILDEPKKSSKGLVIVSALTLTIAFVAAIVTLPLVILLPSSSESRRGPYPEIVFPVSSSPLGIYKSAAVACDNGACSNVGNEILKQGGSVVDAAIASLLCNSVVNMHNLGIGGGFTAILWVNGTSHAFDAYGMAPLNASNETNSETMKIGKLSVLIPGEIAGYEAIHSRFGKLPWRRLFQPAIEICRKGFEIGPALVEGIEYVESKADVKKYPEMKNLVNFLKNPQNGTFYRVGEKIRCPALANTLQMIADNGAQGFYKGKVADMIVADFRDLGVPIGVGDLSSYRVNLSEKAVEMKLPGDGLTLLTNRPTSSGAAAAFVLNILSGYDWKSSSSGRDPLNYHRYIEALKFAWGQWSYFGDISFLDAGDFEKRLNNMTSRKIGAYVRQKINDSHVLPLEGYGTYGTPPLFGEESDHQSTSHVSVLGSNGDAISVTSTINGHFGSLVMGKRTGIIFNNGMANFFINMNTRRSNPLPPPPNNFVSPGKRPMTAISPMIFVDEKSIVRLVVGASGGNRIVSTVPYVALRTLWFGETVKEAVDAFRLHTTLIPDFVQYEKEWPSWFLGYLREKGHNVGKPFTTPRSSITQAIQRLPNGTIFAISDFRKEGSFTAGF